jgi:hypothetical protein
VATTEVTDQVENRAVHHYDRSITGARVGNSALATSKMIEVQSDAP